MKMTYDFAEMEIIRFNAEDVIATSPLINGGEGDGFIYNFDDLLNMEQR